MASFHIEAMAAGQPGVHSEYEHMTGTWQYIVTDPRTSSAVIIDPVLNYDPATLKVTTDSADALLSLVRTHRLRIEAILETHVHADHMTAASYLQGQLAETQGERPPIGIGKRIEEVQRGFASSYGVPTEEYQGVFDKLYEDDEEFKVGEITAAAVHLPGHTPDHMGYKIGGKSTP